MSKALPCLLASTFLLLPLMAKEILNKEVHYLEQRLQRVLPLFADSPYKAAFEQESRECVQKALSREWDTEKNPYPVGDLLETTARLEALASHPDQRGPGNLRYYVEDALTKVFPDLPLLGDRDFGGTLHLTAAGDEWVNAQIVLLPLFTDLTSPLQIQVSDLVDAQGKVVLPADALRLYRQKVVVAQGELWPDPLTPDTLQDPLPRAENLRPYWLSLHVPQGTPAGLCQGTLSFIAGEERLQVPLSLTVLDFDLPVPQRVFAAVQPDRTAFQVSKSVKNEMLQRKELHAPGTVFPYNPHLEELLQDIMDRGLYLGAPGCPWPSFMDLATYRLEPDNLEQAKKYKFCILAALPYTSWYTEYYRNGTRKTIQEYYDDIVTACVENNETLKSLGLEDVKKYVYYDEIDANNTIAVDTLTRIKEKTGAKIITCFCFPHKGTALIEPYRDTVDFIYFSSRYFDNPELLEYILDLQKSGKEIGWYLNVQPKSFATCNMLDVAGVNNRIQFFLQWKYGFSISLFWCMNWWEDHLVNANPPETGAGQGDGWLLFPDSVRGFLPTIRSEILREGMQDYRYLDYLNELFQEAEAKGRPLPDSLRQEIQDILAVNWIQAVNRFPRSPREIHRQRDRILQALQALRALVPQG